MVENFIVLVVLVALLLLFVWLAYLAWSARRWYFKWPGFILACLLTLLLAVISFAYAKGLLALYGPHPVAAVNITVQGTPDQVARGEHLATVLCASCHSTDGTLPLSGGNDLSADTPLPIGTVFPPNITPAGKIKALSDGDIFRIVRTGVEPGGRFSLMGAFPVHNLSDDDVFSIIAYLRRAPAVSKETPPVALTPLMPLLLGAGVIQLDTRETISPVGAPARAVSKDYGNYVASFMDCRGCHGPTLSADGGPLSPPGATNLTVVVPQWSRQDFFTTMRTGVDPTGHQIKPPMPWKSIGMLDDVELESLYQYLHSLEPLVKK